MIGGKGGSARANDKLIPGEDETIGGEGGGATVGNSADKGKKRISESEDERVEGKDSSAVRRE